MTRIHYMSDLHLEMGALESPVPHGDVLVLAGDITLAKLFDGTYVPQNKTAWNGRMEASKGFVDQCCTNFDRVFWLLGNHEHYGMQFSRTLPVLRRAFPKVGFLNNSSDQLDTRLVLVGGTLWTNAPAPARPFIQQRINDFILIRRGKSRFTMANAASEHHKTLVAIDNARRDNPKSQIVVATHHAPHKKGLNPAHTHNGLDPAYYTDLTEFIRERSNIRYWIHGHTHIQGSYRVAQCKVFSNARGYAFRESSAETFNPDRTILVRG